MRNKKNGILKKFCAGCLCAVTLTVVMGISSLAAASCDLTGSLSGDLGMLNLTNTSGNTRYCELFLREYNSSSSKSTVAANYGSISNNNTIRTSGRISKLHAQGVGSVYYSGTPASGIEITKYTSIK